MSSFLFTDFVSEREKERNSDLLFHLSIHPLVAFVCALVEIEPTTLADGDALTN